MCAKKTPTTPTKQNALVGIAKSPVKKAAAKQTTKNKVDDSIVKSNVTGATTTTTAKDVKQTNSEAKKLDAKPAAATAAATSPKKMNKAVATETKASSTPTTPIKSGNKQTPNVKDTKKIIARDGSADAKGRKQPPNGRANKAKASDCDRDKLGENKSNHIRDNKITVKNDEVKSKSNSTNEQCNKFEKSSSSIALKSSAEGDNPIKQTKKLKPSTPTKRVVGDKAKASKAAVKKAKECKIKISNELKNLGIEMSNSNSSLAVVIQEGMTSGVKTSICEMVKTKARVCSSNLNSGNGRSQGSPARKCADGKIQSNKTNKDAQDKVVKAAVEVKAKANNETVECRKANSEVKSENQKEKRDAVRQKNDVQMKNAEVQAKKCENLTLKNDLQASKSENQGRKSEVHSNKKVELHSSKIEPKAGKVEVQSDKSEVQPKKVSEVLPKNFDATQLKTVPTSQTVDSPPPVVKNKISALVNAKNKIKSSNDLKRAEDLNKAASEADPPKPVKRKYVKKKPRAEDTIDESINSSSAVVPSGDARNNDKIDHNKSNCVNISDGRNPEIKSTAKTEARNESKVEGDGGAASQSNAVGKAKGVAKKKTILKVDTATVAAKIKRKYVKKVKPIAPAVAGGEKLKEKPQKTDVEQPKAIKVERDKSSDASELKKPSNESQKNGMKPKSTATSAKDDLKKSPEKVAKPPTPKKDAKVESKVKSDKGKPAEKKPAKGTPKKQKIEIKQESLENRSSESENSSSDDSDSEDSEDTFKKPHKPAAPHNLRNKKPKQFACKRSRVASLNAIAKVHCLYENEARSASMETSIAKAVKKSYHDGSSDDEDESESKEIDLTSKRSLRTAPGLWGIGKHWEMDSMSSEIDSESDVSQKASKDDLRLKSIKSPLGKKLEKKELPKLELKAKLKNQIKKAAKSSPKHKASDESQREGDSDREPRDKKLQAKKKAKILALKKAAALKKPNGSVKRKKSSRDDDKSSDKNVVTKKRMASLNASAILAANYDCENYAAKHESSSTETSDSSSDEEDDDDDRNDAEPPTMKKEKKDVKMESEEPRPKSTNLVKIDTDVTITGVYVNSVSSQETICKTLKYRTAYSVTEECVVSRPPTQEPPKSYTPLSALTNMRPPGGQIPPDPCMTSPSDQYQPPPMFDPHMGPMPPYPYPPHPPPQASNYPPHPMPSTSSAFYAPQQVHRDPMGYYQPAGPLISPHLLPPQPIPQPLEPDQTQSSQSSVSTADNVDPDVMITGGDLAPRPYRYGPHPPQPDYSRQMHQMHYPTYPPSPYGYYGQPPPPPPHQEICYSPYYPPKYYPQNSPYARRYMTSNYYQPPPLDYRPQAVPQNAPSQIVPAAPTPQLIDPHYSSSPYYPGYSPTGGGQCYSQTQPRNMQPPYLDAPQYHSASCPCPMQSCPKNAHTGTGPTKTSKGPVSANALNIAENIPKTASASCKIENILATTIKPENKDKNSLDSSSSSSHDNNLYPKHLEIPELTPSPARGSIGLQIPPTVQHEAVQPSDNLSSDNHSLSQRKQPRVGKSMERERQQAQHITMTCLDTPMAIEMPQFKQEFAVKREGEVKQEKDCEEIDTRYRNINPIENVKLERPETGEREVLSTPEAPKPIEEEDSAAEAVTVNLINESGDECIDYSTKRRANDSCSSGNEDVIELSDNSTVDPPGTLKRRKLLEKPVFTPKKSPPNSYKSLIKQSTQTSGSTTPTYPPATTSKSKLISSSINRAGNKSGVKRRSILKSKTTLKKMRLAVKAKKKANTKKKTLDESEKSNGEDAVASESTLAVVEENSSEATEKSDEAGNSTEIEHNEEKSMDGSSEYSGKSNIDLTIDRVAKGYFSESDIFTCLSKHRKTTKSQKKFKTKLVEKAKKNKKSKTLEAAPEKGVKKKLKTKEAEKLETEAKVTKGKKAKAEELPKKKKTKKQKEAEAAEKDPLALDEEAPSSQSTPKRKPKTPKNAVEKKTKKSKTAEVVVEKAVEPPAAESDEDVAETVATIETRDEETSTTVLSSAQTVNTSKSLLDETDVANNNNECFEDNNRHKQQQESLTLYKTPGYGWTTFNKTGGKRGKKAKFGNRKKHKFTLLNDIVIPKSTSIPRWSNGWVWEGEPYQALVFLNSDDPPVPRTCYDSMRHEDCGDVIRPRDCVLLRAGGKRNELPYVAKVAQLWENPEDGEMMMSLFWYYRPEHTEQGRQDADAGDEVFASRHKDHNSVACIEDKCFVLTYNEYCRYRRNLRSLEENLEEQPSLVPKLNIPERRIVPPATAPELVMFCRRVYDFRAKRLVEDKNKKK